MQIARPVPKGLCSAIISPVNLNRCGPLLQTLGTSMFYFTWSLWSVIKSRPAFLKRRQVKMFNSHATGWALAQVHPDQIPQHLTANNTTKGRCCKYDDFIWLVNKRNISNPSLIGTSPTPMEITSNFWVFRYVSIKNILFLFSS